MQLVDEEEGSPLDLIAVCPECGSQFEITLETPIGVSQDLKAPAALCSPACVTANVQRIAQARCSCGAEVDLEQSLMVSPRLGIMGCAACDWTGVAAAAVKHYWQDGSPAALCGPLDPAKPFRLTTVAVMVDCPACVRIMAQAISTSSRTQREAICVPCQTAPERSWSTSEPGHPAPCVRCDRMTTARTRPSMSAAPAPERKITSAQLTPAQLLDQVVACEHCARRNQHRRAGDVEVGALCSIHQALFDELQARAEGRVSP